MQTGTLSKKRIAGILICAAVILGAWTECVQAKTAAPVVIEKITVASAQLLPGERPDITATIAAAPRSALPGRAEVKVIVVLTRPDRVLRSWQWEKTLFSPGEKKLFRLPKDYTTTLAGTYKVEFIVYSSDMGKRYSSRSQTFIVTAGGPSTKATFTRQEEGKKRLTEQKERQPLDQRTHLAVGVTGNGVNPAGGATILVWPLRHVGLQGSYTVGTFTSSEVRILARYESSSWFNPYVGIGWLQVTKKTDVIGVPATFSSSGPSAHVGIEIPLGRRLIGYINVIGTTLRLRKEVVTATQAATATVTYMPVAVEAGLVLSVF